MSLTLPTRGFIRDGSNMVDPFKVGRVMWSRTASGEMAPHDLHNDLSVMDLRNLNHVFERLRAYRKVTPVLEVIAKNQWDSMAVIKPYLIASLEGRSEARSMKLNDDWDAFWIAIN